jgi:transcriptional regulator with XRE-family HTH domain
LNERLIELRKTLGLTQKEFADKIGIARTTLTGFELGKNIPTERTLISIVSVFGVNIEWLKTGEGDMFFSNSNFEKFIKIYNSLNPVLQEFLTNTAIGLLDIQDLL